MQVNRYKIAFSKMYGKWQVKRRALNRWTVLEEFADESDAIKWAKEN